MDPIYGLTLVIMILGVAVAMLAVTNHDAAQQHRQTMIENLQLHRQNNRLSWDNEILQAELKHISIEYKIPSLPLGAPSRRNNHG